MSGKHHQEVTIWRKGGLDMNGLPTWSAPIHTKVRWEEETKLFTDSTGREVRGSGTIYFPDKVFAIGDFIVKGTYTDATPVKGAVEIKNERSISNLSGTMWEYRALV